MKTNVTQEELKNLFRYNPDTGEFIRIVTITARYEAGEPVGGINPRDGMVYIRLPGRRRFPAHRLAWLYMTGELPTIDIDHIDNNRSNNRWNNLRVATRSQNKANFAHTSGVSNMRGVWPHGKRWRAAIKVNQKRKHLGVFDTKEEAYAAYISAREEFFGEFNPKEMTA